MSDALKVEINSEHRLALCRPQGVLDAKFAGELLGFLRAQEESSPELFHRVLDLTCITEVQVNSAEIWAYATARREATAHLPRFRTAIITSAETETAALVYSSLMKDSQIEVGIFDDAASAADWLGVPRELLSDPTGAG
jgi:hypothetical protein